MPYKAPDKQRAAQLAYYYRHHERCNERRQAWKALHPDRVREQEKRYRERYCRKVGRTEKDRLLSGEERARERIFVRDLISDVRECRKLIKEIRHAGKRD